MLKIKHSGFAATLGVLVSLASAFAFATETKNERIVFIGDSHSVGEFGITLNSWLRSRPSADFVFFASGGSAPLQWRNGIFTSKCALKDDSSRPTPPKKACSTLLTPKLSTLLASPESYSRSTVLIALGTNMSGKAEDRANEIKWAKNLLNDVRTSGAQCAWIGPPDMSFYSTEQIETRYSIIRNAIDQEAEASLGTPCTLIDSRKISHYPKSISMKSSPKEFTTISPAPFTWKAFKQRTPGVSR